MTHLVHGMSKVGDEGRNWTLSCNRSDAVRCRVGAARHPARTIKVLAHGKTNEFGAGRGPNQRAVVTTLALGLVPPPPGPRRAHRSGTTSPDAARPGSASGRPSTSASSSPAHATGRLGGLEWHLVAGGGTLAEAAPAPRPRTRRRQVPRRDAGAAVAGGATAGGGLDARAHDRDAGLRSDHGGAGTARTSGSAAPSQRVRGSWLPGQRVRRPATCRSRAWCSAKARCPAIIGRFLRPLAGALPRQHVRSRNGGNATTGTPVSSPSDQDLRIDRADRTHVRRGSVGPATSSGRSRGSSVVARWAQDPLRD